MNRKFSFEAIISKRSKLLQFDWGENSGIVSIEDRQIQLDVVHVSPQEYSFLMDNQSFDVSVQEVNGASQVLVNGRHFEVVLRDPKKLKKGSGMIEDAAGPMSVSAPMPGKVVKLLVDVGAEVQEGQGVAVVEAMKMQNELKSPKSGVVEKIFVKENQPVNAGEKLLVVK
ncbi:MAG: biotin/lipoyl-containing protein [Terriglobia bacterium]